MATVYYVEAECTTDYVGLNFDYAVEYDTYEEAKEAYEFEVAHPFNEGEREAYSAWKNRDNPQWEVVLSTSDADDEDGDVETLEAYSISYEEYRQID